MKFILTLLAFSLSLSSPVLAQEEPIRSTLKLSYSESVLGSPKFAETLLQAHKLLEQFVPAGAYSPKIRFDEVHDRSRRTTVTKLTVTIASATDPKDGPRKFYRVFFESTLINGTQVTEIFAPSANEITEKEFVEFRK